MSLNRVHIKSKGGTSRVLRRQRGSGWFRISTEISPLHTMQKRIRAGAGRNIGKLSLALLPGFKDVFIVSLPIQLWQVKKDKEQRNVKTSSNTIENVKLDNKMLKGATQPRWPTLCDLGLSCRDGVYFYRLNPTTWRHL